MPHQLFSTLVFKLCSHICEIGDTVIWECFRMCLVTGISNIRLCSNRHLPNIEHALQQPSPALPWPAARRVMLQRFWNVQKFHSLSPQQSSIATYRREPLRELVFVVKILCKHCKNSWTSSGRCKVPHGHLDWWVCLRCGNAAQEVLQDGAEVMIRTKSNVWDSGHVAHSTTFSNNCVAKFVDVWTWLYLGVTLSLLLALF